MREACNMVSAGWRPQVVARRQFALANVAVEWAARLGPMKQSGRQTRGGQLYPRPTAVFALPPPAPVPLLTNVKDCDPCAGKDHPAEQTTARGTRVSGQPRAVSRLTISH